MDDAEARARELSFNEHCRLLDDLADAGCLWLLYTGGGRIEDPAGIQEQINLPDNGTWAAYDLLQVDWIYPGRVYQVQAVMCCFEDVEGL